MTAAISLFGMEPMVSERSWFNRMEPIVLTLPQMTVAFEVGTSSYLGWNPWPVNVPWVDL